MAYSHALTYKGIKRKDARMAKKGAQSQAVKGHFGFITINLAVKSMADQG